MNRQQRRASARQGDQKMVLKRILLTFEDETSTLLDIGKVMIVDRLTKKPLFEEVLDSKPAEPTTPHQEFAGEPDKQSYTVEFDTPEGMMIFVKEGDWSGVKRK